MPVTLEALTTVLDLHYLPCLAYFTIFSKSSRILIEKHEYFVKQTLRNRAYINTEHGKDCLSIPLTGKHGKVLITDVKIDHTHKWVNNHWRTIHSAYGKAPFFEYYADDLRSILFRGHHYVYDLNFELLTLCLKWLRLNVMLKETLTYEKNYANEILDRRSFVNDKNSTNVKEIYEAVPYQQVFGNAFVENLSIIDLIFCCGPEAGSIIKSSSRRE